MSLCLLCSDATSRALVDGSRDAHYPSYSSRCTSLAVCPRVACSVLLTRLSSLVALPICGIWTYGKDARPPVGDLKGLFERKPCEGTCPCRCCSDSVEGRPTLLESHLAADQGGWQASLCSGRTASISLNQKTQFSSPTSWKVSVLIADEGAAT